MLNARRLINLSIAAAAVLLFAAPSSNVSAKSVVAPGKCKDSKLRSREMTFNCQDVLQFNSKHGQWRRSEANAIASGFPTIVDWMTYRVRVSNPPEIDVEFVERLLGAPQMEEPLAGSRAAFQPHASKLGKRAREMTILRYDAGCAEVNALADSKRRLDRGNGVAPVCWDLLFLTEEEQVVASWTQARSP